MRSIFGEETQERVDKQNQSDLSCSHSISSLHPLNSMEYHQNNETWIISTKHIHSNDSATPKSAILYEICTVEQPFETSRGTWSVFISESTSSHGATLARCAATMSPFSTSRARATFSISRAIMVPTVSNAKAPASMNPGITSTLPSQTTATSLL